MRLTVVAQRGACPGLAPLSVVIQELHLEQILNLGASQIGGRRLGSPLWCPPGYPALSVGNPYPGTYWGGATAG